MKVYDNWAKNAKARDSSNTRSLKYLFESFSKYGLILIFHVKICCEAIFRFNDPGSQSQISFSLIKDPVFSKRPLFLDL